MVSRRAEDFEPAISNGKDCDANPRLCLLDVAEGKQAKEPESVGLPGRRFPPGRQGRSEGENGVEEFNRAGWLYGDVIDRNKVFKAVDRFDDLNYRQKHGLETSVNQLLSGNLRELSWSLEHDPKVRNAFANILEVEGGLQVKMRADRYGREEMTVSVAGGKESLVFGSRGGLPPVAARTADGKEIGLHSLDSPNKDEKSDKELNQIFSRIFHNLRSEYLHASPLRSLSR